MVKRAGFPNVMKVASIPFVSLASLRAFSWVEIRRAVAQASANIADRAMVVTLRRLVFGFPLEGSIRWA